MTTYRLLHGDCREVLRSLPEASIDACVTDPPYGIGFMGREWDTFKPGKVLQPERYKTPIVSDNPNLRGRRRSPALSPSQIEYDYTVAGLRRFQDWTAEWAVEVFRVLKPGAYIVVCGAPRSYHRMASGLEDAGFVVRDQFAWLFGSGYPKSRDLGDGKGTGLKPAHEPIALAWKPFKGSLTACHHRHGTAALNIDACRLEPGAGGYRGDEPSAKRRYSDAGSTDFAMTPGPRGGSELGRWPANVVIDDVAAAALDEQSGELVSGANPTRRGSDKFRDIYSGFKGQEACDAARGVDVGGASRFYYCAKPSREERGEYLSCDCETPKIEEWVSGDRKPNVQTARTSQERAISASESMDARDSFTMSCGSTDTGLSREDFKSTTSTETRPTTGSKTSDYSAQQSTSAYMAGASGRMESGGSHAASAEQSSPSQGSISTSRKRDGRSMAGVVRVTSASSWSESVCVRCGAEVRRVSHPTVKPVDLMRWLVRLVTPVGGTVVDPFTGSGTTGVACAHEGRLFIGCEREADYIALASARITHVAPLFIEDHSRREVGTDGMQGQRQGQEVGGILPL